MALARGQSWSALHTDKKENQIFLIYKEIQMGSGAKSYMRKGFLIYEEKRKCFTYMGRSLVIHVTLHPISPNFLIYEENFIFLFVSASPYARETYVTTHFLWTCQLFYFSGVRLSKAYYLYLQKWSFLTPPPPGRGMAAWETPPPPSRVFSCMAAWLPTTFSQCQ